MESSDKQREGKTDLPTGFVWKSRNLHPVRGSTRPWRSALMGAEGALPVPGTAGKLDGESFSHKVRSVLAARLARGVTGQRGLEW
jgi:hypothetical protein